MIYKKKKFNVQQIYNKEKHTRCKYKIEYINTNIGKNYNEITLGWFNRLSSPTQKT